ncbi:MAG TPA: hypothetical protein VMG38_09130 [Trebonia sp.]|nr:hypothetical protein [Trebonia sp.]
MSFDREPGPDDGSVPPVDIVVPDDARDLARDVLAYRREMRARRRRERMLRVVGRLGLLRHPTAFPLIATCLALALLAATMLSVASIGSRGRQLPSASPEPSVTTMPTGQVRLDNAQVVPTTSLDGSLLVLIAPDCGCGAAVANLARQARGAGARVYFVYDAERADAGLTQLAQMTPQYGDGVARTVYDLSGVFFLAFATYQATALLVYGNGVVHVVRTFPAGLDLTPALRGLRGTH